MNYLLPFKTFNQKQLSKKKRADGLHTSMILTHSMKKSILPTLILYYQVYFLQDQSHTISGSFFLRRFSFKGSFLKKIWLRSNSDPILLLFDLVIVIEGKKRSYEKFNSNSEPK